MSFTFGIPCCSSYFTCRLAASSKYRLTKLTWRESRFLDILLLTCYVTRRGLTIPLDTLYLAPLSLNKVTVASWFLMLLHLNSFLDVLLDSRRRHVYNFLNCVLLHTLNTGKKITNDLRGKGTIATRSFFVMSQTRQSRPLSPVAVSGSSHFLFERARWFSCSRAFLVLSCPGVHNPVL